jgi:hypothetical protein
MMSSFGLERQPPVQQADHEIGEHVLLEVPRHVGGRLQVDGLRLLDQRVDDVDLTPFRHLILQELVDLRPLGLAARLGADRLAAGRQLVEHADVEIAVEREGQRARDGRGRHHQHVGGLALGLEPRALRDAEAVLLVDHHQAELAELDGFLHERVRAHDAADLAGGHGGPPRGALAALQRRGQQRDRHAKRLEQPRERHDVLLGQDLGRGHDRGLVARFDGGQGGERGDDRLAGADVALEQPVHRVGRRHVAADLVPHALLRAGERPRQRRAQLLDERAGRAERDALRACGPRAQDGQAELQQQEVFEGQAGGAPPPAVPRPAGSARRSAPR